MRPHVIQELSFKCCRVLKVYHWSYRHLSTSFACGSHTLILRILKMYRCSNNNVKIKKIIRIYKVFEGLQHLNIHIAWHNAIKNIFWEWCTHGKHLTAVESIVVTTFFLCYSYYHAIFSIALIFVGEHVCFGVNNIDYVSQV